MENISIQEIWEQNEVLLDKTRALNNALLREVKTDKAKSSLRSLIFLPVSSMAFFIVIASYAVYFITVNFETWYFMFSGSVVAFFALLLINSSVRQLKQILSVDYGAPIVKMQEDLSKIKISIVTNLRIAAWLLPFSPFVGIFFFRVLFDIDLVKIMNSSMMITFGVITILLQIISLMLLRVLRPKNINKKWLNWLLQRSGSQVDEALGFIDQIKEFEMKDKERL